jgi:sugar lactone lactonase YvrE
MDNMSEHTKFECAAGPYQGPANGVVWDGEGLLISLMEAQLIMRLDPKSGNVSEFRNYKNRTNGLAIGPKGELYGAQEGSRRIIEFMLDRRAIAHTALLDGKHHNHPCDLIVDRSGGIWFTDPVSPVLAFGVQFFGPLDHASVLHLGRDPRGSWVLQRKTYDTILPRAVL